MKKNYLNEIIATSDEDISTKLIQYLMSIRESANLLIMATSVAEMSWEKSHQALSKSFHSKIQALSQSDQNQLSHFTSIIRYRDHSNQCMRGLSITFGRTPESHIYDSTFKNDVNAFIYNLPKYQQGLIRHITLPIIRIALMIHSVRSSLDGSEELKPLVLDDFALLDFNSQDWRYTVDESSEQYEVNIKSNDPLCNSFYLRVARPSKQASQNYLQPCWVFNNKATGFSFYNISELKNLRPLSNKKPIFIHVQKLINEATGDNPEQINAKNIKKLSQSIANHEAYWTGILYDLLAHADIHFERRIFNSDIEIFIDPSFKGRGLEVTKDFLGIESAGIIINNKFSLKYFLDPKICLIEEPSLIQHFNQSLQSIVETHNSTPHAALLEFTQVFTAMEADLVIGQYDKDSSWISASNLNSVDAYGQKKLNDLLDGTINTQQFINLDTNYSIEILKRSISECLLKKWISQSLAIKNINLAQHPKSTRNKLLVLSLIRKQQASKSTLKSKSKKLNVYHCCYLVETRENQQIFKQPELLGEMGVIATTKDSDKLNFIDFYYPYTDNKLCQLGQILDLIEDSKDEELIVKSIGTRYLNNDVTLIFEHDDKSIISIWELQNDDLWIPPELEDNLDLRENFTEFIKRGIESKAYTKSEADGRITQDKRMTKDPHYEIMIDGNKVLIHRNRFNQDRHIGRHILRQFTRIYPSKPLISVNECSFLISGLLSSEAGAYKDSGISQTIFEKIPKLLIM